MKREDSINLAAAGLTAFIGLTVLIGWALGSMTLTAVIPGAISMKSNSAFCFVVSAICLRLAKRRSAWTKVCLGVGLLVIATIATLTLVEYLAGYDFGIDTLLFSDPTAVAAGFPAGRMAPITAVAFILISVSIGLSRLRHESATLAAHVTIIIVLFVAFQSFISYLIGVSNPFGSAYYTRMAIHTSIAFLSLSVGVLFLHPKRGVMGSLTSKTSAGRATRMMLIASLIVPFTVRMGALFGAEHGLFDQDFSQLLQVVGITGLMTVIVVLAGRQLLAAGALQNESLKTLRISEEKFKALVSASAQIQWSTDEAGNVIDDSSSWREFTGQSFDEWKGRGWLNAIHPDDRAAALAAWALATDTKTPYRAEYRLRTRKGEWRWTSARGVPLYNADGSIKIWVGMNEDIEDKKSALEDIKRSRLEAEKANRLKSAFLANMSHEIRTPLGAMIGFNDLLKEKRLEPGELSEYVETISRNGSQLTLLINDILDLSKIKAGEISLNYSLFRPEVLVNEVLSYMRSGADAKKVKVLLETSDDLPELIVSDPARIKQILVKTFGNALKFTESGHIRVYLTATSGPAPGLDIQISDTGIGIDLDAQKTLFETFVQADGSMTRKFGGTGLGLALARRLVRALGGDITLVRSSVGTGTTFKISIPSRPEKIRGRLESSDKPIAVAGESSVDLRGLRLLIVDDSKDNRELLSRYLSKRGAVTESAENGLVGVQKALSNSYDLILMDIQMPVMDGYAATQRLRSEGSVVPIIAITAHALDEVQERCEAVGCNDNLAKPIDFGVLVDKISRLAGHS